MANDSYCKLTISKHAFSTKCDIIIDLGEHTVSAAYSEALKNYTSEIDALNYMSSQGWDLISSYANQTLWETMHILRKKS
jgi:hypothetical protein